MTSARARRAGLLAVVVPGLAVGCVYLNTIYNARQIYEEAENARLAGRDSALAERYDQVISKATRGFHADEDGPWADDALFLVGRAHLRRRALLEADAALRRVLEISEDSVLRSQATLYLGAVAVAAGDLDRGTSLLDGALRVVEDRRMRAEGHLWRARALLQQGRVDQGWWDLDRAAEADRRHSAPAGLERVVWGLALGDTARAFLGVQALLFSSGARAYGDSVRVLLRELSARWGPEVALDIMVNAERAPWSRLERDRLLMTRAWFAYEAGDTVRAVEDMARVGGSVGDPAAEARVTLARWRLAEARQVDRLAAVRRVLLPAVASRGAQDLLNGMRRVELLVDYALEGRLVGFFAAAELTREVLGAPRLAAALFQAYADSEPDSPWSGKALLAARGLVARSAERAWLDDRMEALPGNVYVRYARQGEGGGDLGDLEVALQVEVNEILAQVEEELVARRLLVGLSQG